MKIIFVLGIIAIYTLAFLWLAPMIGGAIVPLSLLPVITAGWLLGRRAGLLAGLLLCLLNVLLFVLVTVPGEDNPFQAIPLFFTLVAVGTITGWLRELLDRVKTQSQELEEEQTGLKEEIARRKEVEAALRRAHDELEEQVQERTLELVKANQALQTEIVERKQVETALEVRARQQATVAELGQRALIGTELAILMEEAVFLVAQTLEVAYVKVLKLVPENDTLLLQAGVGWPAGLIGQATLAASNYSNEASYTLLSGEPVIVADYHQETRFNPSWLLQEQEVVSGVNAIIQGQYRPFGVLGVGTTERRTFTTDDVHFLQAVANVLATVMERQQAEAEIGQRKQELLALQLAGAAITSSLDLQEVLHTVAQAICRWLNMAGCAISEWNQVEDTVSTMVDYGPEGWADKEMVGKVYRLADYPLTERVLVERCPQQMAIDQADIDPAELAYMQKSELTTLLMLPMIFQERVVGLVEVFDDWATRTFTDQELALGQLLANQAASAIENARLYIETQIGLAEQIALREAIAAITSTLDLEAVLSHIAEQMSRVINATSAYICSYDPETMTAPVLAEYISPEACPEEQVSDLGVAYVEDDIEFLEILKLNRPMISHVDDPDLPQAEREHMQQYGAQTILYIPLQVRGQTLGYAELWESRRKREFIPEEMALCQSIAQQAAIAIENARLFEQAQQEIAERRRAEEKIKASLREKEVLLQEIHHRVKNNLQIIASLLSLQSRYVEDPQALAVFTDSQHRIRSMALIHEKLYRSENLAQIDFAEYIRDLAAYLFQAHNANGRGITLNVQAGDVLLSVDTAIPCGLILNELVSNALKHAFPDDKGGEIGIALQMNDDQLLTLIVRDNGVGFPTDVDFQNTTSLGLQLVNTLVKQLQGIIQLDRSRGVKFKITFTIP